MNTVSPINTTEVQSQAKASAFDPERIALLLLALVPAISLSSVLLLVVGFFRAELAVALGIAAMLWLARRPTELLGADTHWPSRPRFFLVLVLVFATLLRWPPGMHVQGGNDHGLYMSMAAHFVEKGKLDVVDDIATRLVSPDAVRRYYENNDTQPGVYGNPSRLRHYIFQFYHVHPLWLAIFGGLFGMQMASLSQLFFALLSIFFGALAAERLAGNWRAGVAYAGVVSLLPLHVFFSKFPISEMPALAFAMMGTYAMLRYARENAAAANVRWLQLAGLAFLTLFLTRISGFVYLPFAYAAALACRTFIHDGQRRRNWGWFWLAFFGAYFASVAYGLLWSGPYSHAIYAMHFGERRLRWIPWLLAAAVVAAAIPFVSLRGSNGDWLRERLQRAWNVAQIWNPALLLLLVALGAIPVALLAFTDHYRGNDWYDTVWRMSHSGLDGVRSSALVLTAEYMGPATVVLLFFALRKPGEDIPRALLTIMVLAMVAYSALLQWFLPLQYYYSRYLLSEVVPFALLLVVVRCMDWWPSASSKPWIKIAAAVTFVWFLWFTVPIVGTREGTDGETSLEGIANQLDGGSALLVDETTIVNPHRFETPLRFWFGKQVYGIRHWDQIYDIVRDLRRAGMSNLLLLSGDDDVSAPFVFDRHYRFEEHAMASTVRIPRHQVLDALNLTLGRLGPNILPPDALATGIELADLPPGCCSGFFPGRVWTKDSAAIDGLEVPAGPWRRLVITMRGFRPGYTDIGFRVRANGRDLPLLGVDGTKFVFAFEPAAAASGLRLELQSSIFVPRQSGIGIDERRLGVDIASLRVE
ncbi:MAG TPA: hypothetical protein VFV97_01120 [Rhodanobacteraceae bacterium]|nr:hypothetical protein [Rhodanobacteraceae bacterium]